MGTRAQPGRTAELLKTARSRSGLTCRELAPLITKMDGSNIAPSYVTDLEKGRGIPSAHIARQFAKALSIDEDMLLDACFQDRRSHA